MVATQGHAAPLTEIDQTVRQLTDDPYIHEFCDFVLSCLGDRSLPDRQAIDLMKIPKLVPNIFIHDYRDGLDKGMMVNFSGTAIDAHYGKVLQGSYIEEFYTGNDGPDLYFPLHRQAIDNRRPFFARRAVYFDQGKMSEKFRLSTTLFFPCSSNGKDVNYGIGIVCFSFADTGTEPIYMVL